MSYLERVELRLAEIAAAHRLRNVDPYQPASDVIDFSSNDYLGLATDSVVVQAFKHATRVGSGGARLLGGRHREHSLLEEELASWLGRERVLLFSSGYLAAIGAITVLGSVVDTIYSDRLNHASLIDGVRSTDLPREIYPHARLPSLADRSKVAGSTLIVTESLFSMDGDTIDLHAVVKSLGEDDVLLVDEAHALGVFGPQGAGFAFGINDPRVVVMGTLSKALGGLGGFIAGPERFIQLLANIARTFIFDTALPPSIALAGRVALSIAKKAGDRRAALHENAKYLRSALQKIGIGIGVTGDDISQIVPIVLGDEERALRIGVELLQKRIYAPPIRPPTVPAGTSRLRVSLRSDHTLEHIDLLVRSLQQCLVAT